MKNLNRLERDEILKQPYITSNDVYKVLPVGKNQSSRMFNDLYLELQDKGIPLFQTRPRAIPTKYFKDKYLSNKKGDTAMPPSR